METPANHLVLVRERLWPLDLVLGLFLVAWIAITAGFSLRIVLPGFLNGLASGEAAEPGFWLIGGMCAAWVVGCVWMTLYLLRVLTWNLFGRETLSTDGRSLRVTKEALGFQSAATYRLDEIEDLVVAREEHSFDPHLRQHLHLAGGWLLFSYRGQKVRCGKCLNLFTAEAARSQILAWQRQAANPEDQPNGAST